MNCCFKPPSLWSFVREATEKSHRPCSVDPRSVGLAKGRWRLDYRTLAVSSGPSEMLKQLLDPRMLRGQV